MPKQQSETQKQLINARRLCLTLMALIGGSDTAALVLTKAQHGTALADLLNQFARLDKKEQEQRKAGKLGAEHGKRGGRPRKVTAKTRE